MRRLQEAFAPLGEKLMELANLILPPIITAVEKVVEWFQSLPEPVQKILWGSLEGLLRLWPLWLRLLSNYGCSDSA